MALPQDVVGRRLADRVGERVRVLIDGPSPESNLVLTGRLEGQAPDIDSIVYLDECDASDYRAGDVVDAVVSDARGYDMVARPLHPARP